ncbi:hypothetical protein E0L36_24155 [Streptomyces sp. AJS327]|uniref:hypothetical protein n=1 Tax=Streptomyces sp. AJS327 TaxID=2545265 RepID=UPI0015DF9ED9|nr:hypothetical protein [Streptomyces sp. AJS327]MBA0053836.1 hypothetical protein [Streptomyces sp. AJS327]
MGSLRNPIGPLPSSIYWRRRTVAVAILVLLVLLVVWAFSFGGDENTSGEQGQGGGGNAPPSTITPGPSDSGPAISDRPGGRDEAEDGDQDGSGGSGTDDEDGADGKGSGTEGGSGWSEANPGSESGGSGGGSGKGVPAGSGLPACESPDVTLSLRSVKKKYDADERPTLELTAKNTGDAACLIDLGPEATVVTVTDSDDRKVWASDDCASDATPYRVRVPAEDETRHTFEWHRVASPAKCGDSPSPVSAGKYEVKAKPKGLSAARGSFTLGG